MKKIFSKNKEQKGYAILFTVVVVSAISVITAGLTNAAYKQLILSSLAKDSQSAFYQADTASDCALYADRVVRVANNPPVPNIIRDGGISNTLCGDVNLNVSVPDANGSYTINPVNDTAKTSCFRIAVTKVPDIALGIVDTTISAKGYNICDTGNSRTVEREIEINYSE